MPKRCCLRKSTCLDYIKLHGSIETHQAQKLGPFQADPRSTLACRTFFHGFFPSSTNSRKASCQLLAKHNGRQIAKKKWLS